MTSWKDRYYEFLIDITQLEIEFFGIVLEKDNSMTDFVNFRQLTNLYEFICDKNAKQLYNTLKHTNFYNCLVIYLMMNGFDCFIRGSIQDPYRMNFYNIQFKIDKLEILSNKIDNKKCCKSVHAIEALEKIYDNCNEEFKNWNLNNFESFSIQQKGIVPLSSRVLKRKDSGLKTIN